MATKFSDIAKGPKDFLEDDYSTKQTLKCKKNAGPVAFTIETTRGEDGALTSKVRTKFGYGKLNSSLLRRHWTGYTGIKPEPGPLKRHWTGYTGTKPEPGPLKRHWTGYTGSASIRQDRLVSVDAVCFADGGQGLETSLKVAPNMTVSFKSGKGADLGIDYTQGIFYATGVLDVVERSKFSTSACVSLPSGIKAGADATYGLSGKTGVTDLNVGASYATGSLFGAVTSVNKFSSVNLGLLYKVNSQVTVASMSSHSGDSAFNLTALGGSYKADFGTIKAKYAAGGIVSASLVKDIAPKVSLTASGSASASDPTATLKYGLGITM